MLMLSDVSRHWAAMMFIMLLLTKLDNVKLTSISFSLFNFARYRVHVETTNNTILYQYSISQNIGFVATRLSEYRPCCRPLPTSCQCRCSETQLECRLVMEVPPWTLFEMNHFNIKNKVVLILVKSLFSAFINELKARNFICGEA